MRLGKYSNFQAVFSSQDQIIGTNFLFHIPRWPLSLGGEMYYTGKEKSGNRKLKNIDKLVALGLRYKNLKKEQRSCLSIVTNPIVGYWSTAYTAYIGPNFIMATRYNINIYSYQTNLSVGCEYVPKDTDHLLKLRLSEQDGLALFYVTKLNQVKIGFGFQTELTRNPRRSFGAEMNIEL
jgi:distribution and morphology protein 10